MPGLSAVAKALGALLSFANQQAMAGFLDAVGSSCPPLSYNLHNPYPLQEMSCWQLVPQVLLHLLPGNPAGLCTSCGLHLWTAFFKRGSARP